jgi:hypothetical protein
MRQRCVGVMADQGELAGAVRNTAPADLRREILPLAGMARGDVAVVSESRTLELEISDVDLYVPSLPAQTESRTGSSRRASKRRGEPRLRGARRPCASLGSAAEFTRVGGPWTPSSRPPCPFRPTGRGGAPLASGPAAGTARTAPTYSSRQTRRVPGQTPHTRNARRPRRPAKTEPPLASRWANRPAEVRASAEDQRSEGEVPPTRG